MRASDPGPGDGHHLAGFGRGRRNGDGGLPSYRHGQVGPFAGIDRLNGAAGDQRGAAVALNPQTGEIIQIKAKKVVKFRVAKAAKDAILGAK